MNKAGLGTSSDADGGKVETWTNELLSLGVRRELLERELQKILVIRQHAPSATKSATHKSATHTSTRRQDCSEHRSGGDHPKAEGAPAGDHAD